MLNTAAAGQVTVVSASGNKSHPLQGDLRGACTARSWWRSQIVTPCSCLPHHTLKSPSPGQNKQKEICTHASAVPVCRGCIQEMAELTQELTAKFLFSPSDALPSLSPYTLLPPSPSPQLQVALAHVLLSQELATKTGEGWVSGGGLVNAAAVGQRSHTQHKGGRRRSIPPAQQKREVPSWCSRSPRLQRPRPGGRAQTPRPEAARPGPARPRSHRRAEPESRGPARPPLRTSRACEGARSALLTQPTPPGWKGCSKHGEKPKTPLGFPLQSFLSVSSQLPFKAELRPPKANSKPTQIRAGSPSQADSS